MKIKEFLTLIILSSLLLNCKIDGNSDFEPKIEFDNEKTIELLSQIFEDEKNGYFSTNCLSEKPIAVMQPMVSDFSSYVIKLLKIEDTTHYNFQYKLFKEFKLTKDIVAGKNIIPQKKFKELENSDIGFSEWLEENCSFGYSSISKPIFNEDYILAYVEIGHICGGLCGGGAEMIYEFIDGKWKIKETLGNWVA